MAHQAGAILVIAKLDRLARNVAFISSLMEARTPFVACDMPTATPFMLHIYAAVAEEEARAISRRTTAATVRYLLCWRSARSFSTRARRRGSARPNGAHSSYLALS